MTGRGKGATACDGQAHQCFHRRPICQRPWFLLRPPSLRSPSRCPRLARCSPGKRTSSCSHTWGSGLSHFRNPNYLRRAETHFRGGATTRASGEAPSTPRRQPALRRRWENWLRDPLGPRRAPLISGSRCAASVGSRADHRILDCDRAIAKEPSLNGVSS